EPWQSASARSVGTATLSYVQTATKSGCDGSYGRLLDPDQSTVTSQSGQIIAMTSPQAGVSGGSRSTSSVAESSGSSDDSTGGSTQPASARRRTTGAPWVARHRTRGPVSSLCLRRALLQLDEGVRRFLVRNEKGHDVPGGAA